MTDTVNPTYVEAVGDLTGFEELAIEKHFKTDFDSLRFSMQLRALVFVRHTRDGQTPKDAYDASMTISVKGLDAYFGDDEVEPMPEEPVTDQGKDDSLDS